MTINNKFLAILAVGLLIGPIAANADIRTWDFAIIIDKDFGSTSLPIGTVLTGNVSVDDTGLPLGVGISQTGLLTGLSFSFGGITYDETTANTGFLQFNSDGSLLALSFGTNCNAGSCGAVSGSDSWLLIIGSFREGDSGPDDLDFAGNTASGISVFGDMSFAERQTDSPAALLEQLGTAVIGVGPGNSLADKIMLAQTYLAVPDVQSTCAMLGDFLNQVRAQRGKKLTIEIADQLTADAQAIMDAIGCN
jgi:hypothetical protein